MQHWLLGLCFGVGFWVSATVVNGQTTTDTKAKQLAQELMEAQGGQQAWDATRYLRWNFFGNRRLYWDKYTGDVRVEFLKDSSIVCINLNTRQGKAWDKGAEVTQPDTLAKRLTQGYNSWINDSYWLVMPYKLQDPGVNLKYIGETEKNRHQLEMTFDGVGNTPQNKYIIHLDPVTKLVVQWDFYSKYTDETPRFSNEWLDYERHGKILLSGNRGQRKITEVSVFEELPKTVFTSSAPVLLP